MEFVRQPERPKAWDLAIQAYPAKTLFHEAAWLDYLGATRPHLPLEYYAIRRDGATIGYFCVAQAKRVLLSLYGSPFPGMGMYLGPLVDSDVDQAELGRGLERIAKSNGIAGLELANDWLDPEVMRSLGFTVLPSVTHVCPLPATEDLAWEGMRGECRTRIRKAQKSGLVAEVTDDESLVDHFFRYYSAVLQRKGKTPHYGIEWPVALKSCLLPADRLFPVWVKHENRVIGAAFYPHDDRTMYYWDGASDPELLNLCPNELLHWTAMKEAIRRGLSVFNMGGGPVPSRFTQKFGGGEIPYNVYRKDCVPFLGAARALYRRLDVGRRLGPR